jgi:hypothetical protein
MTNAATNRPTRRSGGDGGEQLTLLPTSNVHARFRLSRATRERGLRHVAEIRRQLAERQAAHENETVHRLPPRHNEAA